MKNLIDLEQPCVMWLGRTDEKGYGVIGNKRAHRVAWERANNQAIPSGMVVMHSCDNPGCVNPVHLSLGTVAENNQDRQRKGRSKGLFPSGPQHPSVLRRGEGHWTARLSDVQVAEIRQRRAEGETCRSLGAAFGVNHGTVSRITRGIWRQA